jgi:hypothetical protein
MNETEKHEIVNIIVNDNYNKTQINNNQCHLFMIYSRNKTTRKLVKKCQ